MVNLLPIQQATLNLIGRNPKKPSVLLGDAFDYKALYEENANPQGVTRHLIVCGMIAYLFHDYSSAFKYFNDCKSYEKILLNTSAYPFFLFYEGLVSLAV